MNDITIITAAEASLNGIRQQITRDVIRVAMSKYAERTVEAYTTYLNRFLDWCAETGNSRFDAITVALFLVEMEESGMGASSLNTCISILKAIAEKAWLAHRLSPDEKDRILSIDLYKQVESHTPTWLTAEQVTAIYNHIKSGGESEARTAVDMLVFALMVGCGLRISEVADLDFKDMTTYAGHPALSIRDSKGGKSRHAIMTDIARDAVTNWLTVSRITSGKLVRSVHRSGSIQPKGVSRQGLHKLVKRITADAHANVPELKIVHSMEDGLAAHNLRRTYALLLALKGVPLETIQKLLGHASLTTTRRYLGNHDGIEPFIEMMNILEGVIK